MCGVFTAWVVVKEERRVMSYRVPHLGKNCNLWPPAAMGGASSAFGLKRPRTGPQSCGALLLLPAPNGVVGTAGAVMQAFCANFALPLLLRLFTHRIGPVAALSQITRA